MACLGFVTFLPLRPLLSLPCFIARISRSTSLPAPGEYRRPEELFFADLLDAFLEDFFAADLLPVDLPGDFFADLLGAFLVEDFFADLLDFFTVLFFAAFFVAMDFASV